MQSTITGGATPDGVTAQLRDIERQGGGMANLAHVCAGLLLTAFSLGSLIGISGAAFFRFLAEWNAGTFDMPDALSMAVNLLLVLCADVAMLYAASVLRTLIAAHAPAEEQRIHIWAMAGAAVLEAASYLYLMWVFDRPDTAFLWLIGIARALCAPLAAAYLSMARPIPVGPRDVAYQAALSAGKGVIRDVAALSSDPDAPLTHKVAIFRAASTMTPADRAKFDGIIDAVRQQEGIDTPPALAAPPVDVPVTAASEPDRPPTGPGSPMPAKPPKRPRSASGDAGKVLRLTPDRPARQAARARTDTPPVRTGHSKEAQVRAVWRPGMSVSELERAAGVSRSTAMRWRSTLLAEAMPAPEAAAETAI